LWGCFAEKGNEGEERWEGQKWKLGYEGERGSH